MAAFTFFAVFTTNGLRTLHVATIAVAWEVIQDAANPLIMHSLRGVWIEVGSRYVAEIAMSPYLPQAPIVAKHSSWRDDHFRHALSRFIPASMPGALDQRQPSRVISLVIQNCALKTMPPYWYLHMMARQERWFKVEKRFHRVQGSWRNGVLCITTSMELKAETVVMNGDCIDHNFLVINKPDSVVDHLQNFQAELYPVHASGRYCGHNLSV
ncbi:hypothetical protein OG21DRAFT_1601435 [Imleria badia]|nr:hypothetical protein OG21DRAFT_1601435 [Imleria badia]